MTEVAPGSAEAAFRFATFQPLTKREEESHGAGPVRRLDHDSQDQTGYLRGVPPRLAAEGVPPRDAPCLRVLPGVRRRSRTPPGDGAVRRSGELGRLPRP